MTETISATIARIPDTPVGRQLRWHLTTLLSRGEGASLADLARYAPNPDFDLDSIKTDADVRNNWQRTAGWIGPVEAIALESASDSEAVVLFYCAKERKFRLTLTIETAAPHRIAKERIDRLYDFKLETRDATEADAGILAELERRCPIVLGDTKIWFDRGKDYFAFTRLMEEFSIGLAFVDGEPAAVSCGTKHTVKIGGVLHPMVTVSHLRVLPEHQRKGLWGAANKTLDKFWPVVDGSNAYISVDNLSMQHGFRNTPNKWPVTVLRLQLDCAKLAAGAFGRSATADDATSIVAMLNAFHGDEEMFVPYTQARFEARMARAPKQYSWDKILLTDKALVGVWPAGDSLRVITETSGHRTESVRGLVLDYAFAPGGEKDFETLLRAWCAELATRGMDKLSVFSSRNSPGVALLKSLASESEEFFMWSPGLPVPDGAETRGLYVDPVYF
jgi:hypothetical protein